MKSTKKKSIQSTPVKTLSGLMENIDAEIAAIKAGELSEPKARIVAKNRQMQLNSFQVVLQAARLENRLRPELNRCFGVTVVEPKLITQKPQ